MVIDGRRVRRILVDALLVLVIVSSSFAPSEETRRELAFSGDVRWSDIVWDVDPLGVGASVVAALLILLRRRRPLPVLAAVVATAIGLAFAHRLESGVVLACGVAVYEVAVGGRRRRTVVAAGATALVLAVIAVAVASEPWEYSGVIGAVMFIGFAAAIGDAVQSRRAFVASVTERAERAERTRELEAQRRVSEERLRIARELHDAAAHQIAVINLQSGSGSAALAAGRLGDAEQALARIRTSAQSVLGEIKALVRVLRSGEPAQAGVAPPVQGMAGIDGLVRGFERAGLAVDRSGAVTAEPAEVVGIVARKIVQEALTNAHKHGADGRATLRIDGDAESVRIEVTNAVAAPAGPVGHGLVGIQERVESVHGALRIDPGPERFVLEATLPVAGPETGRP